MVKRVIVVLQVFIMVVVSSAGLMMLPTTSHACSCAVSLSVESELPSQTAVFSGKAVEVAEPKRGMNSSSADLIPVTFEVDQTWKGEIRKEQIIRTARSGESCGFEFVENQEYLVYASGETNNLEVNLCGRTQVLLTSGKDIAALGAALKIPMEEPLTGNSVTDKSVMYYSLGVGLFLIAILILIVARRKRIRS